MDKKISQLTAASVPLSGAELLPLVQSGVTKQITSADLSGAIAITKTQFDTLVSTDGLVPGTTYSISGVDTPLYGGTTIIIKAATTNKLELAGHGVFYNPKYLNSQATPNNGYGVWQSGNTYAIGDDAIWGGKHWTNKTGVAGSSVDKYTLDSTNWDVVAFNSTDYNVVADVIHYDQEHDMIVRRKDKWNNDVDGNYQVFIEFSDPAGFGLNSGNPIKDFQWGNGSEDFNTSDYLFLGVQSNYVKDSYLNCINFIGSQIWFNSLINNSLISSITTDEDGFIVKNTLNSNSYIFQMSLLNGSGVINSVMNKSIIRNGTFDGSAITNSQFSNGFVFDFSLSGTLTSKDISELTATSGSVTSDLSSATIIYGYYQKQIFTNSAGTTRLAYYNASDVLTVVNVNA